MIVKSSTVKCIAKTAVFNSAGQVLVLTRSATDQIRPGGLDFPGGEIDRGEDVLAGASREILEETGMTLVPADLQIIYANTTGKSKDGGSADKVVLRFLCVAQVEDPEIVLSFEHSGYKWMSLEEVLTCFETISWAQGLRFGLENAIFTHQ